MSMSLKQRGRPVRSLPPRIDATAEEVSQVLLRRPAPTKPLTAHYYRCQRC